MLVFALLAVAVACGSDGDDESIQTAPSASDATTSPAPEDPPTPTGTVHKDQMLGQRSFDVYEPAELGDEPRPVVIGFHALGGNPVALRNASQLEILADSEGFLIAYPRSEGSTWRPDIDSPDVEFTDKLIDELVTNWNVDPERVYVTGWSNGGDMTIAAALSLSDQVAAAAPVVPALTGEVEKLVTELAAPVPTMTFLGTADGDYQGGLDLLQLWRTGADCDDEEVAEEDLLTTTSWTCGDAPFVVHELVDKGHQWFGSPTESEPLWASEAMWEFFSER